MLRCTVGSISAEDLAPERLTSSLNNSMLNAPMLVSDLSVKPVPKICLDLIGTKTCTDAWASVYPIIIGFTDAIGVGLTGAADSASFHPIRRCDHLDP